MPYLYILVTAFLIWTGCGPDSEGGYTYSVKTGKQPNILFIMSDDHTSQAWGIYGGVLKDHVRTPNIHRLADEGMVAITDIFFPNKDYNKIAVYSNGGKVKLSKGNFQEMKRAIYSKGE